MTRRGGGVAQYAVLRIDKKHTIQEVAALGHHNERTRPTPNADPARLAGTGDWCGDVQARLAVAPTIRANAVIAIEHVMTASREWYARGDEADRADRLAVWTERSMAWLRERYGEANVVAAILHKDEMTPHI